MNLNDQEDRSISSAEYVMGSLSDAERDAFAARLSGDAGLQAEVGFWQDRMLGLVRKVAPVAPPPDLWNRIEAALPGAASPASSPVTAAVRGLDTSSVRRASQPLQPRWWDRLGFWQGLSGFAVAAAILLASLMVLRPVAAPVVSYVAVLQSPDQRAGWVVQASEGAPARIVPLVEQAPIPPGRSWQLWTKGRTATRPTSLGLVQGPSQMQVPWNQLPELSDEQLFEITLEPEGGSPTGLPTGPILFIGKAQRV